MTVGVFKNPIERSRKISEALKGKPKSKEHTEKIRKINLGRKLSNETKKKIGLANKTSMLGNKNGAGHIITAEQREKRKKNGWFKNPEQTKKRMSLARVGRFGKEKHPNWKGGISYNPYSVDWTKTLKRAIREKYNYTCQICNCYAWVVHHIDYNKLNCNPKNLIVVCKSCHAKTNFNRETWIRYFENK